MFREREVFFVLNQHDALFQCMNCDKRPMIERLVLMRSPKVALMFQEDLKGFAGV